MTKPPQNDLVRILYSNCVPRLVYGAAVKDLNSNEKHQVNVAVNNAIRRIFGFRQYQSIRQLREFYGFKPIERMFEEAKARFHRALPNHRNGILQFLSTVAME